jgi:hypothetical protein
MAKQDMCPICAKPFQKGEFLIRCREWGGKELRFLAHIDCALLLSQREGRNHSPAKSKGATRKSKKGH